MGIARVVRNTVIGIVVLAVVLVGGGFAYTYFLGPDGTQTAEVTTNAPEVKSAQQVKPAQQDPKAPVSASVSSISSPVAPGDNALVSVRTSPMAKCTIAVEYGGAAIKDSGLAPKTADEFGTLSWSWTVAASAPVGKWPVKVNCVKGQKSAVVQTDQVIEQKSSSEDTEQ